MSERTFKEQDLRERCLIMGLQVGERMYYIWSTSINGESFTSGGATVSTSWFGPTGVRDLEVKARSSLEDYPISKAFVNMEEGYISS